MNDIVDGLPNIYAEDNEFSTLKKRTLYANVSNVNFKKVRASFGIALHMHQPTIPAGGGDLKLLYHFFKAEGDLT